MGRRAEVENGYLHQAGCGARRGDYLQLQCRSLWVSFCYHDKMVYLLVRHDAQICYCGEPNCVGTIGGKTQTDIGGMNDLFLDGQSSTSCIVERNYADDPALGIREEVESMDMKGSKKKKSRQLDDIDYIVGVQTVLR